MLDLVFSNIERLWVSATFTGKCVPKYETPWWKILCTRDSLKNKELRILHFYETNLVYSILFINELRVSAYNIYYIVLQFRAFVSILTKMYFKNCASDKLLA